MTSTQKPQLFSGDLRPFPGIPQAWPASKAAAAAAILADVHAAFPEMLGDVDPDADIEDFWEDAARVSAAWRAAGGDLVAKAPGSTAAPWTTDEIARRFGPVTFDEEGGRHAVDKQLDHSLVRRFGGRGMKVGSLGGHLLKDVARWLAIRHADHGVQRGIVKAAGRKNGIWSIALDSDPEVVRRRLVEEMDWTYIRLEGLENGVLAQDELELEYELRLFVVDGVIVSAAGCVEEFTPLDRVPGKAFDTRVRRVRGHLNQGTPSVVEDRPDVVERLLDFGHVVAALHGGTVVIDVAIDAGAGADGVPVVIELNDLPNSGLYASDPWLVAEALVDARDRGYTISSAPALPFDPAQLTPVTAF